MIGAHCDLCLALTCCLNIDAFYWYLHRMPKILSITPVPKADAARIRSVHSSITLTEAPGWFDGEYRDTWPAYTITRYLPPNAWGSGSRAERDALLAEAEIVLASWPFPLDLRARAPMLKWFHQRPAGASNLRRSDLWGSDVLVSTSRGYGDSTAIAEYAVAGLLHFSKGFNQAAHDASRREFDPTGYPSAGLNDKTVCVLGTGGIGSEVARLCVALGMRAVGIRRRGSAAHNELGPFSKISGPESLRQMAAESDCLVVACQWTPATDRLVKASVLINVSRGEIIDEADLLDALDNGPLRGAALDVYVGEFEAPPPESLWAHPKVLITPHTSAITDRPANYSLELFITNLARYLASEPLENLILWERGY